MSVFAAFRNQTSDGLMALQANVYDLFDMVGSRLNATDLRVRCVFTSLF